MPNITTNHAITYTNDNLTFNQNYPSRPINFKIVYTKEMVFQQKLFEKAYFNDEMTGPAMVRPAT